MTKSTRIVAVVALTAAVGTSFTGTASAAHGRDPQRYCRTSEGNGWSNRDVAQAIRCAVGKWHVAGGASKALSVARCESGLNERDRNSCCSGVFQQHRSYWRGRFRRFNPHHGFKLAPGVYNARTNVVISIVMAHRTGWSDWSCA